MDHISRPALLARLLAAGAGSGRVHRLAGADHADLRAGLGRHRQRSQQGFSIDNLPVTGVPAPPTLGLALEGALPNPALGGRLTVGFRLPSGERAVLELIDVTGRRARGRSVGALGAGRHVLDLGEGLKPGLYFLRLTQGANQLVRRVTVMD